MVHLVWIGVTGVLQSILSSLILKVYHAFAFKPITIKFGEFTNFWILFQMTCPIFNSIDIEHSYQEKICLYPVPCSFRTWPIEPRPHWWEASTLTTVLSLPPLKLFYSFHCSSCTIYSTLNLYLSFRDKTKLISRLVLRQEGQLILANILTNRASLLQGPCMTLIVDSGLYPSPTISR